MTSRLGSFLPSQHGDVAGLLVRTLRSGQPGARSAVAHTALGLLAVPVDRTLRILEQRLVARSSPPREPILIVCGPPRSGTSLVAQVLLRHLPVSYFSNLTNVFPRSPMTATRLFGRRVERSRIETRSYYGKTRHLSGPNDALYLWDRWLGEDRQAIPAVLSESAKAAMLAFFGAWQSTFPGPLLAKNNRLVMLAGLVADVLPTARFLCLRREPIGLAMSLLEARKAILGDVGKPYGAVGPAYFRAAEGQTPERQVCLQVLHYEEAIRSQQARLAPDRFQVIDYTDFCRRPDDFVRDVASRLPGVKPLPTLDGLVPFRNPGNRDVGPDLRRVIESHCLELGLCDAREGAAAC